LVAGAAGAFIELPLLNSQDCGGRWPVPPWSAHRAEIHRWLAGAAGARVYMELLTS